MAIKTRNCPNCGCALGLSDRKLYKLYEQEFGAIPVLNMIDRGWLYQWLGPEPNKSDIPAIEKAIFGFFEVEDEDALWELFDAKASKTLVNGVPMQRLQ